MKKKYLLITLFTILIVVGAINLLFVVIALNADNDFHTIMCDIVNVSDEAHDYYHEIRVTARPICKCHPYDGSAVMYTNKYNEEERVLNYSKIAYNYYKFLNKIPCKVQTYFKHTDVVEIDGTEAQNSGTVNVHITLTYSFCTTFTIISFGLSTVVWSWMRKHPEENIEYQQQEMNLMADLEEIKEIQTN